MTGRRVDVPPTRVSPMIPPPPGPPVRRQRVMYSGLIAQLGAAKKALDDAQARYDALTDQAREELPLGRHVQGTTEVLITKNRFWDGSKARGDYGDRICSLTVDQSKARGLMTGDQFDLYFVDRAPRVVVKEVPRA